MKKLPSLFVLVETESGKLSEYDGAAIAHFSKEKAQSDIDNSGEVPEKIVEYVPKVRKDLNPCQKKN